MMGEEGDSMKERIVSEKGPAAIGPYSPAVKAGGLLFVSGQLPIDANSGAMAGTIEEQTRQSLANLRFQLEAAGLTMDAVVKTTVFLKDMNDFAAMNGVYATFFSGVYPARSAVQVARLPKDALVEIEAIATLA